MEDSTSPNASMVRSGRRPQGMGRSVALIAAASTLAFAVPIVVRAILDAFGGDRGASSPVAAAVGGMLVMALWQLVAIAAIGGVAGWLIGRSCSGRRGLVLLGLIGSMTVAITLGGIVHLAGPPSLELGYVYLDSVEVMPIAAAALAGVTVGAVVGYAVAPHRTARR